MSHYLFPAPSVHALPVMGEDGQYPIGRIFCVGRNYAAHAAEMGGEVDREAPWYFTKSAQATCQSGATIPYPPGTENFHYEMELVVALGGPAFRASPEEAAGVVFAYGCGLDMTRRDRQQDGKDHRRPWSLGKDIEHGAVLGPLTRSDAVLGPQRIHLSVNGDLKQDATLLDMVWSVPEVISHLSHYYHLRAGDIIMTGTPAGVGPVVAGDVLSGGIDGLEPVTLTLGQPE